MGVRGGLKGGQGGRAQENSVLRAASQSSSVLQDVAIKQLGIYFILLFVTV